MLNNLTLKRSAAMGIAALAALTITAPHAYAGFIATIQEVGSNVVATGSGTINTSALTSAGAVGGNGFISSAAAILVFDVNPSAINLVRFNGVTGPASFGGLGQFIASSFAGSAVGINGNVGALAVPTGYVSGTALSATEIWNSTTIFALGITPGTYTWTWGSGATADSFTITTTPEPTSIVLVGSAMLGLLALRRRIAL